MTTKLTKFIAATGPVARLQLHSDSCRVAVLLPQTTSLEVNHSITITITSLEVKHNNNNTKPSPTHQRLDEKLASEITGVEPALGDETPQIQPEPGRLVSHLEEGHSCRRTSLHGGRAGGWAQNRVFFGFEYEWKIG